LDSYRVLVGPMGNIPTEVGDANKNAHIVVLRTDHSILLSRSGALQFIICMSLIRGSLTFPYTENIILPVNAQNLEMRSCWLSLLGFVWSRVMLSPARVPTRMEQIHSSTSALTIAAIPRGRRIDMTDSLIAIAQGIFRSPVSSH
jgi:hypothetical protein